MPTMEKWLVISACQTVGLANCIQSLVSDALVTGIDFAQFNSNPKRYGMEMKEYSKLFINPGVIELLPAGQIEKIPDHVASPAIFFRSYHPDLIYLEKDGTTLLGPLGDYHSAIAFACYTAGMSLADTIGHFNGGFFERCGFMSTWVPERERLIREMAASGIDIAGPMRRWGRQQAFMHSSNHPRIHALYDVAKELVRMQGRTPIEGGIIPHDNLQVAPHFAIYPEIGEALGVEGSYIFKNDTYRPIDLVEFITRSFEVYDSCPPNSITPHPHYRAYLEAITARL